MKGALMERADALAAADRNPFQTVYDHDEFCQGDILHRDDGAFGGLGSFGMVITADCDIAQRKDGGEFTVLRIVPAEHYVTHDWAAIEVRKLAERQGAVALDALNAAIGRQDSTLHLLTTETLRDWLADEPPERIVAAVGLAANSGAGRDAARALHCMVEAAAAITGEQGAPIDALTRVWRRLDMKDKAIQARLSDVLHPARGAADAYFIPYLPGIREIGFVIHLRGLFAVQRDRVHRSPTDARIAGGDRRFQRIGRFRDGIKYSIVHQVVTLFSRIGLSELYEQESSTAATMVIDGVFDTVRGSAA